MKKLFLVLLLVVISLPAFSQIKVRPGIRLGVNASTITNLENSSRKTGFTGAMFANIHFARFYELQPELTYSNQGVKRDDYSYVDPFGDLHRAEGDNFNIHYMGISVANKFFVIPDVGLHFIAGPSIEINVSDDSEFDEITPVDFSLFGGIGYEFPFGLSIEARYKQGFIDMRDDYYDWVDDNDFDYYDDNFLNSTFQFSVSYKFDF